MRTNHLIPEKYPYKILSRADERFFRLLAKDATEYITPGQEEREVLEKFDDYRRPYSTHGLGVIDCPYKFQHHL